MSEKGREPFPLNLVKMRRSLGWTQQKAADLIGIKCKTYQSYEEGRAVPSVLLLPTVATVMKITDIIAFVENPDFDPADQEAQYSVAFESGLQKLYDGAGPRIQKMVDLALGIGVEAVNS